mmetsp:Transcript_2140/g.5556  ORF Transcript_2140/g.5556 Transcript_2140/m.5556 type:complete len:214 (-) Transcript_2140:45-686(-)
MVRRELVIVRVCRARLDPCREDFVLGEEPGHVPAVHVQVGGIRRVEVVLVRLHHGRVVGVLADVLVVPLADRGAHGILWVPLALAPLKVGVVGHVGPQAVDQVDDHAVAPHYAQRGPRICSIVQARPHADAHGRQLDPAPGQLDRGLEQAVDGADLHWSVQRLRVHRGHVRTVPLRLRLVHGLVARHLGRLLNALALERAQGAGLRAGSPPSH